MGFGKYIDDIIGNVSGEDDADSSFIPATLKYFGRIRCNYKPDCETVEVLIKYYIPKCFETLIVISNVICG